jgi:hypothetical protein
MYLFYKFILQFLDCVEVDMEMIENVSEDFHLNQPEVSPNQPARLVTKNIHTRNTHQCLTAYRGMYSHPFFLI